jgi:hypothetical protein
MDTDIEPGDHRANAASVRLVIDAASLDTAGHLEPASRETVERLRLGTAMAVAFLPTLALWALIWFALTQLISNWP